MDEGKTERIGIGDLLARLQKLLDDGWLIRTVVQINPGAEPEDACYKVIAVRRHPEVAA